MAQCPVCQTEYVEGQVERCSTCDWYLKTDPLWGFGSKLPAMKEWENWGKKMWEHSPLPKSSELPSKLQIPSESEPLALDTPDEALNLFADKSEPQIQQEEREERRRLLSLLELAHQERRHFLVQIQQMSQERSLLMSQLSQLQNGLKVASQERAHLHYQINQLTDRLQAIEQRLSAISQGNSSYSVVTPPETETATVYQSTPAPESQSLGTTTARQLSPQEAQLVASYNHKADSLSKDATEVSETEDSINQRRLGSSQPAVLEKTRRGNYWILTTGQGLNHLVPKNNMKVNEHSYEAVQALFKCHGYQPGYSNEFKLLKPAIVSRIYIEEKWTLVEPGVLKFESISGTDV